MQPEQVWQAALGQLQLEVPKSAYDTWMRDTALLTHEDGEYVVGVNNAYAKDWLENRLCSTVKRTLSGIVGRSVEVRFVVWPAGGALAARPARPAEPEPLLAPVEPAVALEPTTLNPKYIFETFVVGPSNRLAHAASLAAAENPAKAYNPLFIYGGVGLGKTHLLHAIGHSCQTAGLEVLYVSSEQFTNDLINAIRNQDTTGFRDKYRTIDVLLIDDIQFIAGKESTQEEFFHTFNALHGNGKQLIISSDRPPKSMVTLEERLRSRFEWGLIADIQPPDIETRTAILRAKAEGLSVSVPSEVLDFIARQVQSNIRELEGALNRVVAHVQLTGDTFSVDAARAALADLVARPASLSTGEVIQVVANYYHLPVDELVGRGRNKELVKPRQVAMYLCREEMQATLPQIGEALGGRDHTTVMYGVEKIIREVEQDDNLRREVLIIRERLYNRQSTR